MNGQTKTCEECSDEYPAGTGFSEVLFYGSVPPHSLEERFCSKRCAMTYELEFDGWDVEIRDERGFLFSMGSR